MSYEILESNYNCDMLGNEIFIGAICGRMTLLMTKYIFNDKKHYQQ